MGLLDFMVRSHERFLSQFPRRLLKFGTKLPHPRLRPNLFNFLLVFLELFLKLLCHSDGLVIQMDGLRRLRILL
jgi:hypothetical protein